MKLGTSLGLLDFHDNYLQQVTMNEWVCAKRRIGLYEFEGFGVSRLIKTFTTKGRKKTALNDF